MATKDMKGALPPKEHWEKNIGDNPCMKMKYSSEMGNPEELKKSVAGLNNYVKSHRMKY